MLLKDIRVDEEDRDPWLYFYEAEYDPKMPSVITSIQDYVLINFWGTVLSNKKLDVPIVLTENEQAIIRDHIREKDQRGQSGNPFVIRMRGETGKQPDQCRISLSIELEKPLNRIQWEDIEELLAMVKLRTVRREISSHATRRKIYENPEPFTRAAVGGCM